ncbi:MAG: hypothetical protein IK016_05410 [Lachnospiraceae bacterium]|nr:hypothetical protein [Lachnospiraceae bacterium]
MAKESASGGQTTLKNDTLLYLQGRYDDSFVYEKTEDTGFNPSEHTFCFSSNLLQGRKVRVRVSETSGGRKYSDNYLALKYEAEIRKLFLECAEQVFDDVYIIYTASDAIPYEVIQADASVKNYLKQTDVTQYIFAVVSGEELQSIDAVRKMSDMIASVTKNYQLTVVAFEESSVLQLEEAELKRRISEGLYVSSGVITNVKGVLDEHWNDGGSR